MKRHQATLLMAGTASAHDFTVCDLKIIQVSFPAPVGPAMSRTPKFSSEVVASTKPVEALEFHSGDSKVTGAGGDHSWLTGVSRQMNIGDMLPAHLIFEQSGRFEGRRRNPAGPSHDIRGNPFPGQGRSAHRCGGTPILRRGDP